MEDKRRTVFKGFIWSFAEKMLIQVITFIVGIILARKLGPNTYGIVAIASVVISMLTVFNSFQTGTYLMRKKNIDSIELNTSFYFNIIASFSLYIVLFLVSPLVASFYKIPELTSLIRTMGLTLVFSPFMGPQLILIVRNYDQKKLFFASFVGTIVAGAVGILLAFKGFGPWALVSQHCLDGLIDTVILWLVVKWKPKKEFSFKKLKEMISYGIPLWAFGIFDTISTRLHALIIGRKYSSADLAYYNKGESIPLMVEANTTSSLNTVLLKRVSEDQDDIRKVGKTLLKINQLALSISLPTMFGLAAVSNALIYILLGNEWMQSVIYMNLFCVAFAFKPIEATSDITLKAIGKSRQFFRYGVVKKALFLISVLIAVFFNIKAIAIGFLIASLLSVLISIFVNKKIVRVSVHSQIESLIPPFLSSFIMYIFVQKLDAIFADFPIAVALVIQVTLGIIIYALTSLVLNKATVKYFYDFLKQFFRKAK